MPYCKEFIDLFDDDLLINSQYQNQLFQNLNLSKSLVDERLVGLDCSHIHPWLSELFQKYIDNKRFIRPFHLGLGNPDADILIIGKELAINVKATNPPQLAFTTCDNNNYYKSLFVNEAILNYFLWSFKVHGKDISPNCCIQDPQFPSAFCKLYNKEKNWSGHYWASVSKIVGSKFDREIKNSNSEYSYFTTQDYQQSFFKHVFLTELHDIPSSQSPSNPDSPAILQKLSDLASIPFFRKFKRIVFACRTYLESNLSDYKHSIQSAFQQDFVIQKDLSRNIKSVLSSPDQRIIICSNLAGAAGWSNVELELMASLIK